MIKDIAAAVPATLLSEKGAVFRAGPAAYHPDAKAYVLGPCPDNIVSTIAENIETASAAADDWSDYVSGSWSSKAAGAAPVQRRVQHVCAQLGVAPQHCPSSSLVFTAPPSGKGSAKKLAALVDTCWPVHDKVLHALRPRSVICYGAGTADHLLERLPPHRLVATFTEDNKRAAISRAYRVEGGLLVFALSNPGQANWANPDCDPSGMMRQLLAGLAA